MPGRSQLKMEMDEEEPNVGVDKGLEEERVGKQDEEKEENLRNHKNKKQKKEETNRSTICDWVEEKDILVKKIKQLEELSAALEKKNEELKVKNNLFNDKEVELNKLKSLANELEGNIKCPVCLDIPNTIPVYSCPNGHLTCSICYQGLNSHCSLCRRQMFATSSLLAKTVIENIDHVCKYEGCQQKISFEKIKEHSRICTSRPVICPVPECNKNITYKNVMDHILNECEFSERKVYKAEKHCLSGSGYVDATSTWTRSSPTLPELPSFSAHEWNGNYFFLIITKDETRESLNNFYLKMFGSEDECRRYKVTICIELKKTHDNLSIEFRKQPSSIEAKEEATIVVSEELLSEVVNCCKRGSEYRFSLHLKIVEKK